MNSTEHWLKTLKQGECLNDIETALFSVEDECTNFNQITQELRYPKFMLEVPKDKYPSKIYKSGVLVND